MFWLLLYIAIALFVIVKLDKWMQDEEFEKIPGPKAIPLLGNALDFLMDRVKLIYKFLELDATYKDVYKVKMGPKKFVVVMNPEDVEMIISGANNSSKGFLYSFLKPWLKKGLLLNYGEGWQHRRKILTPAFHFKILQHFCPMIGENVDTLVKRLKDEVDKPQTDAMPYIGDFTLGTICETAMGIKLDPETSSSGQSFKQGIHTLGQVVIERARRIWLYPDFLFALSENGRLQKMILQVMSSFRDKIVKKRRETVDYSKLELDFTEDDKSDDVTIYSKKRLAMLDMLLKAEKDGVIDAAGIAEEVDTFVFEGHDTTSTSLQYSFMLLAHNPKWQDKIVEECDQIFGTSNRVPTMADLSQMKILECCIKESLRLHPPVFMFTREIDNDTRIKTGNYVIPKGTDCIIAVGELHRRADQYVEPLAFRPERFMKETTWHPYSYIPFSAGPRNCIGQKFAMMEMKLVLSAVLRQYKILPVTKPSDLMLMMDLISRTTNKIYVKFEYRKRIMGS